jgi:hypothetical protein
MRSTKWILTVGVLIWAVPGWGEQYLTARADCVTGPQNAIFQAANPPTSFLNGSHYNTGGGSTFALSIQWLLENSTASGDNGLPPCPAMYGGGRPVEPHFAPVGLANCQTIRLSGMTRVLSTPEPVK